MVEIQSSKNFCTKINLIDAKKCVLSNINSNKILLEVHNTIRNNIKNSIMTKHNKI